MHVVKRPVLAHLHRHIGRNPDQRGMPTGQGVAHPRDRDPESNAKRELVAPRDHNTRKRDGLSIGSIPSEDARSANAG